MRSLSLRILLASFATILLSLAAFMLTFRAVSAPSAQDMRGPFENGSVETAAATWAQGGRDALRAYLTQLDRSGNATHYMTDARGRDLVTGGDRSGLLNATNWFGPPQIDGKMVLALPSRNGRYRLITLLPPPFSLSSLAPYFLLIVLAVAFVCWLLAIGIVAPLQQLARAVGRFGRGDHGVRVRMIRRDEIGDLARAFNEMAERIETLLAAEKRLLQDISHELRSPLARLNIAIELARTAPDRDLATGRLQREADRLGRLVGGLIEITRIEGDPSSQTAESVLVSALLAAVVDTCDLEAEARHVRICTDHQTPAVLYGHPELLRRAVENVVRNAIRYAPARSEIDVHVSAAPRRVVITVRDRGPGVLEELLPRLTQPFFRVDQARSAGSGGLGLGLAIAHRAVQLHHGTLRVENASPGLLVTLSIPTEPDPATTSS